MLQRWRTFWALSSAERAIARAAAMGLAATWLGLRVCGFRRWRDFIVAQASPDTAGFGRTRPARNVSGARSRNWPGLPADRIAQLERAAARNLFFPTNCLEQSLVLWSLLRRRGFPAELKFGARKRAGHFEAHAWVALHGCVLSGESDEHRQFVPFEGAVRSQETQPK